MSMSQSEWEQEMMAMSRNTEPPSPEDLVRQNQRSFRFWVSLFAATVCTGVVALFQDGSSLTGTPNGPTELQLLQEGNDRTRQGIANNRDQAAKLMAEIAELRIQQLKQLAGQETTPDVPRPRYVEFPARGFDRSVGDYLLDLTRDDVDHRRLGTQPGDPRAVCSIAGSAATTADSTPVDSAAAVAAGAVGRVGPDGGRAAQSAAEAESTAGGDYPSNARGTDPCD